MRKLMTKGVFMVMMAMGLVGMTTGTVSAHSSGSHHSTTTTHCKKTNCKKTSCSYKDKNHNKKCDSCGKKKSAHHNNKNHH